MKIIKFSNFFNEQLFHGSSIKNINKLVPNKSVLRGYGIFLSNSLKYAKVFGEYIYICEVNLSNPKTYDDSLDSKFFNINSVPLKAFLLTES